MYEVKMNLDSRRDRMYLMRISSIVRYFIITNKRNNNIISLDSFISLKYHVKIK